MLTLYHTPLSLNSRRVWVTLLEKGLHFDTIEMNLSGDQFQPEFLALNPFHHIPVLVDDEVTLIESFAIMDYLEAKYPIPSLLPSPPTALAKVRMIQMVTVNELLPAISPLTKKMMGFGSPDADALEKAHQQAAVCLGFCEEKLADWSFFGGDELSLADIVLGTVAPWFDQMELPLDQYPQLQAWIQRLLQRQAWQITQPTPEAIDAFKERMAKLMAQRGL
ncbi:glutathione S-transferase [Halomicronema hongdechloris C2206]|uniref:Glutathione S-transferase n=1 Tax=Halomicronema hongdechloris C2206 TaxID=1641165 RepID=A0A1Z3HQT1_9CYAN|nr:glutathione S-transferase family protein [Halomicronema hongdechloris]ASC72670.1 glutathione S-transferase [Halomicronema hongdechloris C2206]